MASGDTLLVWTAHDFRPSSTNGATKQERGDGTDDSQILEFDDTTNELAVVEDVMPQHYGGGGVTAHFHFCMDSATSGDVDIDGAFDRIGDSEDSLQDIDSRSFAAVQSSDNNTVPGTAGHVDIVTATFTDGAQMDSVAAGESFAFRVTRDAMNDTATGDMHLVKVELRET